MLKYIIIFWILQELTAPTWCWVCYWIAAGLKIFEKALDVIAKVITKNS